MNSETNIIFINYLQSMASIANEQELLNNDDNTYDFIIKHINDNFIECFKVMSIRLQNNNRSIEINTLSGILLAIYNAGLHDILDVNLHTTLLNAINNSVNYTLNQLFDALNCPYIYYDFKEPFEDIKHGIN